VSLAFGQQARAAGIARSIGLKRRLFRQRRRRELLRDAQEGADPPPLLADIDELRTEVFDYIEVFYNRQRRHRSLGQLSPHEFEDRRVIEEDQINTAAKLAA
jgi:transposase InsO family protein